MGKRTTRIAVMAAGVLVAPGLATTPSQAAPITGGGDVTKSAYVSAPAVTPAAAKDLRRFWTPERMRAATPARVPAGKGTAAATAGAAAKPAGSPKTTEPRLPSRKAIAAAARAAGADLSAQAVLNLTVGKAFFIDPIDGREHVCSGATVNSGKRRLVITAGHCVHNGLWMQGWIFAPGYDNGAPVGTWIAGNLAARTDWIFSALPAADVGVAIMDGTPIVDVVGGNGLSWNQGYGMFADVFGYPTGGNTQGSCAGNILPGLEVSQVAMTPCNGWNRGSSGSPMLQSYGLIGPGLGYVNSVVSTIYTPITTEVFGPYFDSINAGLLYYAETISP